MTLETRVEAIEDRVRIPADDPEAPIRDHVDRIERAAERDPKVKAMIDEFRTLAKKHRELGEDAYDNPEILDKWHAMLEMVP